MEKKLIPTTLLNNETVRVQLMVNFQDHTNDQIGIQICIAMPILKSRFSFLGLLVLPLIAIGLGLLGLYALSKDQPKCPFCKAFVSKNSNKCKRCGAPLSWD